MRYRSANPVLRSMRNQSAYASSTEQASYTGVVLKSGLLLFIMSMVAMLSFSQLMNLSTVPRSWIGLVIVAPIIAFISVIIGMRSLRLSWLFSLIYALCQGLFLGVISGFYEIAFGDGIVATAMLATVGVFTAMLILYSSGMFRVTEMFRRVLFTALLGLVFTSLFLIIFSLFGVFNYGQMMGLIFAIVVISVIVASLYLMVDFDNIRVMVEAGADKRTEWMLSLGLIITLVWLYIELLRLIAILRSRR